MKKYFILKLCLLTHIFIYSQNYPTPNSYTNIYTRKGTAVQGTVYYPLSSSDYSNSVNFVHQSYPNVIIQENPTSEYNCYSYAFHLSEGNTQRVWINPSTTSNTANLSNYWTDGSFIQVCNEADGDKALYVDGDHAAKTTSSVSGKYESKWGANCRVIHLPTDVPYNNPTNRRYYASTKISGSTSSLCSGTRTFSVKNITGATYTWTYSSSLIAVGSTNTSSFTVQRNGSTSGAAWVQVQITTTCSGSAATSRADFTVGSLLTGTITQNGQSKVMNTSNPVAAGSTSVQFQWPGVTNISCVQSTTNPPVSSTGFVFYSSTNTFWFTLSSGQSISVNFSGTSSCDGNVVATRSFYVSGYSYTVNPNPATDNLTITVNEINPQKGINLLNQNGNFNYTAYVYDANTNALIMTKHNEAGNKQIKLNISSLRSGYYIVELVNGTEKKSYKIFKQ